MFADVKIIIEVDFNKMLEILQKIQQNNSEESGRDFKRDVTGFNLTETSESTPSPKTISHISVNHSQTDHQG